MSSALLSHAYLLLASTYGSGTYGTGTYNGAVASNNVIIGPISLPVTGAGLMVIIGALSVAAAVGWFVWLRQNRSKQAAATDQT